LVFESTFMESAATKPRDASGAGRRPAGKFFVCENSGAHSWWSGVTYGPFPPNRAGEPFPERARLESDLDLIRSMGFNLLRVYEPPSDALLDAAARRGLRILATFSWTDHVDFLASRKSRAEILKRVREQARRLAGREAVAGVLVGNEIDKTLVRWMGPGRVRDFVERLVALAKRELPGSPVGYASYPSTEYLAPRNADFLAVNVFLEKAADFSAYLARLHSLAGNKPVVITEFGLDARRAGEEAQRDALAWSHEAALAGGAAGMLWFSFTDEWWRGGRVVRDWQFGLVDARRRERAACGIARRFLRRLELAPSVPLFSVVVCSYNGSATLEACLVSLERLRYPRLELILVDDGSTDSVPEIAARHPLARYLRLERAGLSAARNAGAEAASGELLAFTDDDCVVHEDWLTFLLLAFAKGDDVVAAGGPNVPPSPRTRGEALVAAAPGGPSHVLLDDCEAEHLPGCNLALRKSALLAIGGFDTRFRTAGDDVDVCWRLRDAGGRLVFAAGAMVWHHRRDRVGGFLRQQRGYGRAEALLARVHPRRFGPGGGARWRGLIYGDAMMSEKPAEGAVFFGPLGEGAYQVIYRRGFVPAWGDRVVSVWPVLAAVAALAAGWWMAGFGLLGLVAAGTVARWRALPAPPFPLSAWERLVLLWVCLAQGLARQTARWMERCRLRLRLGPKPAAKLIAARPARLRHRRQPPPPRKVALPLGGARFWSESGVDRQAWCAQFEKGLAEGRTAARRDDGWRRFDYELHPKDEVSPAVISVTEYHGDGRCLTRVRLMLRVTRGVLVACGLVLALELVLATGLGARSLPPELGWGAMLGTSALLLGALGWTRARLRKRVRDAALAAGLKPA
jgi:GT2 family glycosyltransferase